MTGRLETFATNVLPCPQVAAMSKAEDFTFRDEGYYAGSIYTLPPARNRFSSSRDPLQALTRPSLTLKVVSLYPKAGCSIIYTGT